MMGEADEADQEIEQIINKGQPQYDHDDQNESDQDQNDD